MADDISNVEIIQSALSQYIGQQQHTNGGVMICCPFHSDRSPSLGINLNPNNDRVPLGFWNCLGCEEKGPWNKLAEKMGWPQIKAWNTLADQNIIAIDNRTEDALLGTNDGLKQLIKRLNNPAYQPWPAGLIWRGYSGSMIQRLKGLMLGTSKQVNDITLLLPVYVNGEIRGGVEAMLQRQQKTENKRASSYLTTPGEWAKDYGLLQYDLVVSMLRTSGYRFVILVEGPRDMMRLIRWGIPAMAILGAKVFSEKKARLVAALPVDTIYVLPDNDQGGKMMWKTVKQALTKQAIPCKRIKLPAGEAVGKMDPNNMPTAILRKLVKMLERNHQFKAVRL